MTSVGSEMAGGHFAWSVRATNGSCLTCGNHRGHTIPSSSDFIDQ